MTDDLNEKLAKEAAELINGGEFYDGKWYSEGHREAWRKAMKPAADRIEALETALEKARSIAKNGWITANCGTIGDADYGAELCEYIADQIAALGEKKDV